MEVHVDGHVEADGVVDYVHGGEDFGSHVGVGGGEHGWHAEAHGGEAEEDQAAPQSVQLALHDKGQPPPQPVLIEFLTF